MDKTKTKVGITGHQGFVGWHLWQRLQLDTEQFELVPFERDFFDSPERMDAFVFACDVIVHLAAMNRHPSAQVVHDTNCALVDSLVAALKRTDSRPHVLFSSSSQEERDNLYGKSKKYGREKLREWAAGAGARFTGLIIPNVFGPFCKPFYNSFIATFCHQLSHNEQPQVDNDATIALIYIDELVASIKEQIAGGQTQEHYVVATTAQKKVSEIRDRLVQFRDNYLQKHIIPEFADGFDIQLFNTFRSYISLDRNPVHYTAHTDQRGAFVELIRLGSGGQVSFSTTHAGITRGNHFHTRKIERFAVIQGEAQIQLRKIGADVTHDFALSGAQPSFVDMPVWYTHNITNTGESDLYTIFWINEFYDPEDADTFFETV